MTATRISLWFALFSLVLVNRANAQPTEVSKPSALVGTQWSGTEDLAGFGKLTFQFLKDGKAIMIDTAGTTEGTYELADDVVVISFKDGEISYAGKIKGNTLSGAASSKQPATWTWKVTQVVAQAAANNPAPAASNGPPAGAPAVAPAKPAPAQATPDTVAEVLRKLGFDPKIITPDIGPGYCIVALKDKDNWTYHVEVKVNKGIWLTATLDQLPKGAPDTEKLMRLLEANDGISPCYFFFRAADRRLCMKLEVINGSNQALLGDLQRLTSSVRMTYDLWNTANWAKETLAEGGQ